MSTIKSSTTLTTAYSVEADTTGALVIQTGAAPTTAVTVAADQSVTFAQAANLPNTFGFKNRIINGAMVIDQRNAGASVSTIASNFTYTLDRWAYYAGQASKFTLQQSTTVPSNYKNSIAITSSSAYSVVAGDIFVIDQPIEGLNIADFGWGTATASTVTLSFWVRSSLTGTFGGSILNSAFDRSYPFTYTISVANTFEYKTVTIAGDTSGTWLTTNGVGLYLSIGLGVGSTFSGTAGAWAGSQYWSATGATSVVGTNGATFYITGVQLEKGSTATSFDYRPYGAELALCQRYYVQSNSAANNSQFWEITGRFSSTTQSIFTISLPVTMRAQPAISVTPAYNFGGGWYSNLAGITNYAWTSAPSALTSFLLNSCVFTVDNSAITSTYVGLWADPYCPTTASANYFAISAEL
jgi:hypothetical protein